MNGLFIIIFACVQSGFVNLGHLFYEKISYFSIESIENPIIYLVGFSFVINCFVAITKIKCNYFA